MFKNFKEKYVTKSEPAAPQAEGGEDLATMLDRSQRADLVVLVTQITEFIRKAIVDNFNTPTAGDNGTTSSTSTVTPVNPQDDHLHPLDSTDSDVQGELDLSPNVKRQDTCASVKDLRAEADALSYFSDWSDSVLLRIADVVNNDEESKEQQGDASASASQVNVGSDGSLFPDDEPRDLATLRRIYPPVETPLVELPKAKRLLILHSLLLLLLSLEHYNAYSRVLMLYLVSSLGLSLKDLNDDEYKVARGLLDAAMELSTAEAREQTQKSDSSRKWKVGIASVAGAALIGITGGLAAPLVAAGLGTVMGGLGLGATAAAGYLGALAGSSVIVGGLFGAYGGRMTGRMMDKYAREVEDFAFIPIRGSRRRSENDKEAAKQDHRLRVTIGITGWVTEEENFVVPWRVIGADSEVFALRWELESLMNLGNAISALVSSAAWTVAGREVLSRTFFAQILSAVMLPLGLLKVARVVDNPFSVAKARADKAGQVLADVLINKAQGERPITLIGYSLGSRVIYSCLQSLAKRRAYGLVESAILMGSPTPSNVEHWRIMRSVVSGRLVNVFSENDAVLAFLYRTSSLQLGVAGLQPVQGLPGVENVDASDLISGHLRYQYLIGKILTVIGLEDVDAQEVSREEAALQTRDKEQEQERIKNERQAGVEGRGLPEDRVDDVMNDEGERLQRQVEQKTQERLMNRKVERMRLRGN